MKWGGATILNLEPGDAVIRSSAQSWKDRYKIPDNRCFALSPGQKGFVLTSNNCLAEPVCFLNTKLMIFSHGNDEEVAFMNPIELGDMLTGTLGLRRAGLIAVRSCESGKGNYLEQLAHHLAVNGAQIGWLIGYKHSVSTMGTLAFVGEAREVTTIADALWHLVGTKASDADRVKVIKGNVDVRNGQSRRYNH